MLQFLNVEAEGVIGHISTNQGQKGTRVTLYINKMDQYGNHTSTERIVVTLYNDAERYFLKNNARVKDLLTLRDAPLSLNQGRDGDDKYPPSIACHYYRQVRLTAHENHMTLIGRKQSVSA